jgi:hypothetical protein
MINNIKIKNFNLAVFSRFLNQSLIVNTQIMMEVRDGFMRSCSFSETKSFVKLWTVPLENLIVVPEDQKEMFEKSEERANFKSYDFNFYILRGDIFKKFISVHNQEKVDLEFAFIEVHGKQQAASLTITGTTAKKSSGEGTGSQLRTSFALTSDELLTSIVSDYSAILRECTPTKDMFETLFGDVQVKEIKSIVKELHRTSAENSKFLSFRIGSKNIIISDRVFSVEYPISPEIIEKNAIAGITLNDDDPIVFNILKGDFIITGDMTFGMYTSKSSDKVIITGTYGRATVVCMTTKITESSAGMNSSADDSIGELNLTEYGLGNEDDLPF